MMQDTLDFLRKDIIDEITVNDVLKPRNNGEAKVCVNGRCMNAMGKYCSTTVVARVYRCYCPSNKSYKYVLHAGVSKSDRHDIYVSLDEELEKARINALINPDVQMVLPFDDYDETARVATNNIVRAYADSSCPEFVMTYEEICLEEARGHSGDYGKKYPEDWAYFDIYAS